MSISSKDLHTVEVKIRLAKRQAEALFAQATALDIPPAVLARHYIDRGLKERLTQCAA
jgi:hypothetical protein